VGLRSHLLSGFQESTFRPSGEKELEHFTLEVLKSRNVMHPLEEKATKDFRISGIDISAIPKTESGRLASEVLKSRSDVPLEVGCGHGEKWSHVPRCGPRANRRLKLFLVFWPIGFRGIEEPRTSTQGFMKSQNPKSNCWLGRRGENLHLVHVRAGGDLGENLWIEC
jgi:hypothetical protein